MAGVTSINEDAIAVATSRVEMVMKVPSNKNRLSVRKTQMSCHQCEIVFG
jgi:hypothetical protein